MVAEHTLIHDDVEVTTKIMSDKRIIASVAPRADVALVVNRLHSGETGTGVGFRWAPLLNRQGEPEA